MDFRPNDDHAAIIEGVDRVCSDFDDEYWTTCDTEHTFPWEFYEAMAAGGWVGICIPEEFG
ncbi:MAG: acyl-CoA dehydrogenase family protein, partial [Actinomycetota bacterium]|nr:acyl-CoA dehydrogenase family protein [Actinomycetota bacterium]